MAEDTDLIIEGTATEYTFFPGDATEVSHAEFLFRNGTSEAKNCEIQSCVFIENDMTVPLPEFHVYSSNNEPLGRTVKLPPKSEKAIRVTFPARQVNVGSRFKYEVQINVECDGKQYSATSRLNLIQEKAVPE